MEENRLSIKLQCHGNLMHWMILQPLFASYFSCSIFTIRPNICCLYFNS